MHYRKYGGEVNSNPGQTGREIKECNQLEGISKYRAVRDADIDLPSQSLGIDQIKYIPSNVKLWDAETLDAHGSDYTVAILKKWNESESIDSVSCVIVNYSSYGRIHSMHMNRTVI